MTQDAELLRHGVRGHTGALGELVDLPVAGEQRVEQLDPAGGTEGGHALCHAFGLALAERADGGAMFVWARHASHHDICAVLRVLDRMPCLVAARRSRAGGPPAALRLAYGAEADDAAAAQGHGYL